MRAFTAHTAGGLYPLTRHVLRDAHCSWEPVLMRSDTDYPDYFAQRWREGEGFVNCEQDVVPWPGAVEELMHCPENWCGNAYQAGQVYTGGRCYFGLVKFSSSFIAATPGIWEPEGWDDPVRPRDWRHCDARLSVYAAQYGLAIHQHFPAVTHANGWKDWT
jgi:hypothetical protein